MKRAAILGAVCMAVTLTVSACGAGASAPHTDSDNPLYGKLPKSVQDSGTLKIGGSATVAPYLYKDGTNVVGFEKDLMDVIGKTLGVKIKFTDTGFPALVPGLQSRKIDVAMGDFTDTKERQQAVAFVDYTTSYQTLFVQKGNPKTLSSTDDLCGASVAAAVGSLSAKLAEGQNTTCEKAGKRGMQVLQMEDGPAALMQVRTKRADAMVIDYVIGSHVAKTSGSGEVVGEPFYEQFHGAAVRKENSQLRDALVAAFDKIIKNGSYGKILEKWDMQKLAMSAPSVNAAKS
ncbi:ABC transporter substrate-binding protein [Streptomyces sp. NBC_01231]|nr:ABC transporter substrate-binding protein [Streptomyces sp. NBC_01231]